MIRWLLATTTCHRFAVYIPTVHTDSEPTNKWAIEQTDTVFSSRIQMHAKNRNETFRLCIRTHTQTQVHCIERLIIVIIFFLLFLISFLFLLLFLRMLRFVCSHEKWDDNAFWTIRHKFCFCWFFCFCKKKKKKIVFVWLTSRTIWSIRNGIVVDRIDYRIALNWCLCWGWLSASSSFLVARKAASGRNVTGDSCRWISVENVDVGVIRPSIWTKCLDFESDIFEWDSTRSVSVSPKLTDKIISQKLCRSIDKTPRDLSGIYEVETYLKWLPITKLLSFGEFCFV